MASAPRPSLSHEPNGVAREALTEKAEIVGGTVVLHAGVRGTGAVEVWADVFVDGEKAGGMKTAHFPALVHVVLPDGGEVGRSDIVRLLNDRGIDLRDVVFAETAHSSVVGWHGIREDGSILTRRLVLHATMSATRLVVYGEITVDGEATTAVKT